MKNELYNWPVNPFPTLLGSITLALGSFFVVLEWHPKIILSALKFTQLVDVLVLTFSSVLGCPGIWVTSASRAGTSVHLCLMWEQRPSRSHSCLLGVFHPADL